MLWDKTEFKKIATSQLFNFSFWQILIVSITFVFLINSYSPNVQAANSKKDEATSIPYETTSAEHLEPTAIKQKSSASFDKQKPKLPQEKKLHVTSDNMLVEKESSTISFSGNVIATQGDTVIKADKVSVFLFTDKEKKALPENMKQEIKSITASGNVRFESENRTAFADKAVYTATDHKIILTGESPRVMTGESYVTGKKIILFQNSGKVIVEGGKEKRVEALFNSKEDFKQEN